MQDLAEFGLIRFTQVIERPTANEIASVQKEMSALMKHTDTFYHLEI